MDRACVTIRHVFNTFDIFKLESISIFNGVALFSTLKRSVRFLHAIFLLAVIDIFQESRVVEDLQQKSHNLYLYTTLFRRGFYAPQSYLEIYL